MNDPFELTVMMYHYVRDRGDDAEAGSGIPGMSAEITLDGKRHAGTVTAISPEVRQSQVTGRVKFSDHGAHGRVISIEPVADKS